MRVLVTGGTGFVGGWTAKVIADAGHSIRFLVRNPARLQTSVAKLDVDVSDYAVGNITDRVSVRDALQGCDAVLHSAALVATDPRRTSEMLTTNMQGAQNVLGQAVELGLDPIIHVSSFTALFRPNLETLRADLPVVGGADGYGTSKAQVEIYARGLQDAGAPVNITYPGMVLGPPVGDQYGEAGEGVKAALQMHAIPGRSAATPPVAIGFLRLSWRICSARLPALQCLPFRSRTSRYASREPYWIEQGGFCRSTRRSPQPGCSTTRRCRRRMIHRASANSASPIGPRRTPWPIRSRPFVAPAAKSGGALPSPLARTGSYSLFLGLRTRPSKPAPTNGTGASAAINALLAPTRGLLRSPSRRSALSLIKPTVAQPRNSPPPLRTQAAQAPDPRTTSRIPIVCMSNVSVPDSGLKNRPDASSIAAPTPTRATATIAKMADVRVRSCVTDQP
jgi:dihydroflavonol-4-reductase